MTLPQWLSIGTLAGMMALFLWGRFRYDVTAVIALLAALALGIVKFEDAFKGFSDDIVIIVGSALVMSAAVQRCCHQRVDHPTARLQGVPLLGIHHDRGSLETDPRRELARDHLGRVLRAHHVDQAVVELVARVQPRRHQLVALDDEERPLLRAAVVLLPDDLGEVLEALARSAQRLLHPPARASDVVFGVPGLAALGDVQLGGAHEVGAMPQQGLQDGDAVVQADAHAQPQDPREVANLLPAPPP